MQNANAFDPKLIAYAKKNTKKEFKIILENLFSQKNKPSAIFLFNESCIQNFMDALSALKIRIPKDVSLLVTASKQPTIKGIKLATFGGISPVERGEEAAKTLIGMIEGKIAQPVNIKLKLNILEGESCRKLK
jgi:DNA-binding LacI/PurR family transcriptional regulator